MKRKLDNLGRIVLFKEARDYLGIKNGDEVDMELTDDSIIVKPVKLQMKNKSQILIKVKELEELVKLSDDEQLKGTLDALKWVLEPADNQYDYLNDYDDLKEKQDENTNS